MDAAWVDFGGGKELCAFAEMSNGSGPMRSKWEDLWGRRRGWRLVCVCCFVFFGGGSIWLYLLEPYSADFSRFSIILAAAIIQITANSLVCFMKRSQTYLPIELPKQKKTKHKPAKSTAAKNQTGPQHSPGGLGRSTTFTEDSTLKR